MSDDPAHGAGADDIVLTFEEAASKSRPPLLVLRPLQRFLDDHGLGSGAIRAKTLGDGHSNFTYLLERSDIEVVLRRPPRPPVPPSTHDVLREAALLQALETTDVPVPMVRAVCADTSVIGSPFYLMDRVEGTVISSGVPAALDSPSERRGISERLIEVMVALHAVEWSALNLGGFGRPTGYLERQLRRFRQLWEVNRTRELPEVARVAEWLEANMPRTSEATLVHGDFRPGNAMFASRPPATVTAMLDWEMATIGDPLADIGYLTVMWSEDGDPPTTFDLSPVTRREGFLTRDQLASLYEELSGRSVADLRWYQVLALWKTTVFMEGNFKRTQLGASDDPFLKQFRNGPSELAARADRLGPGGDHHVGARHASSRDR